MRPTFAAALIPYPLIALVFYSCWSHPDPRYLAGAILCLLPALRPRLPKVAAGLLVFAVMRLPWQLRNAQTERTPGEPDLLAYTLYHGSFPGLMYKDDPRTFGIAYRFDPEAPAHGQDAAIPDRPGPEARTPGSSA